MHGLPWLILVALALPVIGLAVLLGWPELDLAWQHQPIHFWLVLLAALLTAVVAVVEQ